MKPEGNDDDDNDLDVDDEVDKGRHQKKIRNYLGIFPKCRTPPPFWEPLDQKKNL